MTQTSVETAGELSSGADGSAILIRALHTNEEFRACVELQRDIWGWDQSEIVPATLLHVVEYVGGLAVGAFDGDGTLLGFVFGITGVRDGDLVHWSHMLGVRESTRNHGVGRLLKEHQRTVLHAVGAKRIYWSFDPLQAKNAYFNVNRLGAVVEEYIDDMYGKTVSPLHLGMATDRLVMRIDTAPSQVVAVRLATDHGVTVLTPFPHPGDRVMSAGERLPEVALLEIPENILDVLRRSASTAQQWRVAIRENFRWALGNGYAVQSVYRNAETGRVYYVVVR